MPHRTYSAADSRAERLEALYELRDALEHFIAATESLLRLVLTEIGHR